MRIAVRVDASPRIGLGHLKRCLSLADALRHAGAEVVFICRRLGVDVRAWLSPTPFVLFELPSPPPEAPIGETPAYAAWAGVCQAHDCEETVEALRALGSFHWVVVDHYAFDESWHRGVAAASGARIAVIDDLADRPLAADLLIDHNFSEDHRMKYVDRIAASTRVLGGPRFALLGSNYADAPRYRSRSEVHSIGIFMGGTDPDNLSACVLDACREVIGLRQPIEIVTTRANPHLAWLEEICQRWPDTSLSIDLSDLAGFFARHDLQIGAGGGATWERCCIGAPTLAMIAADNQRKVLYPLQALGVLHAVPEVPPGIQDISRETDLLIKDGELRAGLAARAQKLVDGNGAARVANQLLRT